MHAVFHISQLKKAIGDYSAESQLPDGLEMEAEEGEEPEELLAARSVMKEGQLVRQWLVRWKGRAVEDTTWEDELLLKSQFPSLSLEDKAAVPDGGNDRISGLKTSERSKSAVWRTYVRKGKKENKQSINDRAEKLIKF